MNSVTTRVTGTVAWLTLDRPPLNVLDLATANALADAIAELAPRTDLHAVVIEARGRAFSAGVDVRDHFPDRGAAMLHAFHRACIALWKLDTPTLARIHGAALGGGAELTLMCDLVWAAESATFAFPEIRLGVFPPVAAATLATHIPAHAAAEMILTGRTIDARAAERLGLVNRVVPDEALDSEVERLLQELIARSASSLRATKQAMRLAHAQHVPEAIAAAENHYLRRLLNDRDAIEGLEAFLEKRAPHWGGAA